MWILLIRSNMTMEMMIQMVSIFFRTTQLLKGPLYNLNRSPDEKASKIIVVSYGGESEIL
jgi:hypothetical protein